MPRLAASLLLLFLGVLAGYLANGRTIGAGDTLPARYLPWSLLREQTFALDRFPVLYEDTARRGFPLLDGVPYYLRYQDGHYYSAYSPGPGVLALPVYAGPVLLGVEPGAGWPERLEKLSAALITALSVVFLHRAVRALVSARWALGIALIYAFGTSAFSVSSQGLWQHGPSQMFLALCLYCLVRGQRDERYLAYAGFPMAAAVAMRSTDVFLLLPVGAWIVWTRRTLIPRFLLWASVPLAGLALHHLASAGGASGTVAPAWALFSQVPLHEGLAGVLVSPSRGLFVYSPVLLFSIVGCLAVWRRGPAAFKALSLGLPLVVLVVSKWFLWWGGHSWGPRLLADAAPILCFFLHPLAGMLSRRPVLTAAFVVLALASVGAHTLGAFAYDRRWDGMAEADRQPARLWSWTESPLAFYGREAFATAGRFARPAIGGRPTSADSPDQLAASYEAGPIPHAVVAGEPMPVAVTVRNTGQAVWLASAPDDRGAARLGWRWDCCGGAESGGRASLPFDVPPGESARLTARISAPAMTGDHSLVVDMVSERVTWFADRGSKPIRATVSVSPPGAERLLAGATTAVEAAPAATIATDRGVYRAGDRFELTVTLSNPLRPWRYDAYLVLQGPRGDAFFYDGRSISARPDGPFPQWAKDMPLPARAVGRFSLHLPPLIAGAHAWHVVLTRPGTYDAVARHSTPFRIEP